MTSLTCWLLWASHMPSTSPLLWSEWAFLGLNIAISKVLWMQMRIIILDFVSFISMTGQVGIRQTQKCLAGSSVAVCRLPAPQEEPGTLRSVESHVHSDVVACSASLGLRHQQHTSCWCFHCILGRGYCFCVSQDTVAQQHFKFFKCWKLWNHPWFQVF